MSAMNHVSQEDIQLYADGELADVSAIEEHLRDCAVCANAIVSEMQLKRAVREAARFVGSAPVPRRRSYAVPLAIAAAVTAFVIGGLLMAALVGTRTGARELADLHATILASANPVDVLSTDRHTVKPWFEGRLPFSFPIPELANTPFRLLGGRVVWAHEQPVAYLMVGKASHKLSLFVSRVTLPSAGMRGFEALSWRANGLNYVAVGDVPQSDLRQLRDQFVNAR